MHVLDTAGDSSRGSFIDRAPVGESKERYIYSGYTAMIEQQQTRHRSRTNVHTRTIWARHIT